MITRRFALAAPRRAASVRLAAAAVLATLLAGCTGTERAARERPSPNVVLISIDCFNRRQFDAALDGGWAPALAALAADGVVFTRGYTHAPWTTPSHMSMLTGLYPTQHGRDIPWEVMQRIGPTYNRMPAFESLAERLKARGYQTVAFVGQGSISGQFGLAQGFDDYREHLGTAEGYTNPGSIGRERNDLPKIDESLSAWWTNRRPGPFFLFFHTYDLHEPRSPSLKQDEAAIRHVDHYVGRLLFRLREIGAYDSTLIVLTGDHGSRMVGTDGKCCGHGVGHYEENVNVPFVVKFPGPPTGERSDMLVRHVDILPTVFDVIEEPLGSYRGPGVSIRERLRRPQDAPDPVTVSYSEADGRCRIRRALVTKRYKYIYTPQDERQFLATRALTAVPVCPAACANVPPEELYDLQADPRETTNLLKKPLGADAAAALRQLRAEMTAHLNLPPQYTLRVHTDGSRKRDAGTIAAEESVREAMRQLGYAQ